MKLSICCITYNHGNFIAQAIDSFLMQQVNFDFEIIIADDHSTDNTTSICKAYEEKYPGKFKLILRDKNIGMIPNFIGALQSCNGEYIAVCDGDDYWTNPNKLQKQVDFLETNSDFIICFHKVLINKNGDLFSDYLTKVPYHITYLEDLIRTNYMHTPSVLFRNKINLPDWYYKAFPGDHILWLLLADGGGKIKYMDDCMAVYRIHPNGVWSMQNPMQKFDQVIKTTYLRCALHLKTAEVWVEQRLIILRDSVSKDGFQKITKEEYILLVRDVFKKLNYNWYRKLVFLNPRTLKFKRKIIHGIHHCLEFAKKELHNFL